MGVKLFCVCHASLCFVLCGYYLFNVTPQLSLPEQTFNQVITQFKLSRKRFMFSADTGSIYKITEMLNLSFISKVKITAGIDFLKFISVYRCNYPRRISGEKDKIL